MVEELRRELPKLDTFITLSPVPGFMQWLKQADDVPVSDEERTLLENLDKPDWFENAELTAQLRAVVEPLAAHYFLKARTPKGRLIDSVARFHIGNGARLEKIDWLGDLSPKGLRESAGVMVNYLYRLEDIEKNHEAYANQGEIAASSAVKKMLKTEGRRLLDMRLSLERPRNSFRRPTGIELAMADGATSPRPIGPAERIDAIDVLRGIALLGVVAMNVVTEFRVSIFERFLFPKPPLSYRRSTAPSKRS